MDSPATSSHGHNDTISSIDCYVTLCGFHAEPYKDSPTTSGPVIVSMDFPYYHRGWIPTTVRRVFYSTVCGFPYHTIRGLLCHTVFGFLYYTLHGFTTTPYVDSRTTQCVESHTILYVESPTTHGDYEGNFLPLKVNMRYSWKTVQRRNQENIWSSQPIGTRHLLLKLICSGTIICKYHPMAKQGVTGDMYRSIWVLRRSVSGYKFWDKNFWLVPKMVW